MFRSAFFFTAATALAFMVPSMASAERAHCIVTKGENNGFRFVGAKCALESDPHHYKVRMTVWESEDPERYKKLARFPGGRKFSCEAKETYDERKPGRIVTHITMSNCR